MAADHPPKRTVRTHPQQMVNCPRCQSPDTKFCYYNNYSTTQPRYFCKNCKRYWTDGGTLRNVPVGGGLRKNKRSKTKAPTPSTSSDGPTAVASLLSSLASSTAHQFLPSSSSTLTHENHINNHGLPNSTSVNNYGEVTNLANPAYALYNPGMYEPGPDQAIPHPLSYGDMNFNNYIPPLTPLSILSGLKQNTTSKEAIGTSPLFNGTGLLKDQERPISLQHAGLHSNDKDSAANYTINGHVNMNDWQQISENLFGGSGESNLFFMQPPQQTHQQWPEFNPGTRL